jgi:ABC-type polysaccharide transport system permease subunit
MKSVALIIGIMTLLVLPHLLVELMMTYAPMLGLIAVIAFIVFVIVALYKVVKDEMSDM